MSSFKKLFGSARKETLDKKQNKKLNAQSNKEIDEGTKKLIIHHGTLVFNNCMKHIC